MYCIQIDLQVRESTLGDLPSIVLVLGIQTAADLIVIG